MTALGYLLLAFAVISTAFTYFVTRPRNNDK